MDSKSVANQNSNQPLPRRVVVPGSCYSQPGAAGRSEGNVDATGAKLPQEYLEASDRAEAASRRLETARKTYVAGREKKGFYGEKAWDGIEEATAAENAEVGVAWAEFRRVQAEYRTARAAYRAALAGGVR